MDSKIIGKVTATERVSKHTCTKSQILVRQDMLVRPFDIVKIENSSRLNDEKYSYSFAIIKDLNYISDSASDLANYVSSDFGDVHIDPQKLLALEQTIAIAKSFTTINRWKCQ